MTNFNLGPYAKFLTAAAGLAVTLLTQKYGATAGGATWLPYVVAAASALGVYGVPNAPKMLEVSGTVQQTATPPPAPITSTGTMRLPGLGVTSETPTSDFASSAPASQAGPSTAATEGAKGT
jgi:hypothetical protein